MTRPRRNESILRQLGSPTTSYSVQDYRIILPILKCVIKGSTEATERDESRKPYQFEMINRYVIQIILSERLR